MFRLYRPSFAYCYVRDDLRQLLADIGATGVRFGTSRLFRQLRAACRTTWFLRQGLRHTFPLWQRGYSGNSLQFSIVRFKLGGVVKTFLLVTLRQWFQQTFDGPTSTTLTPNLRRTSTLGIPPTTTQHLTRCACLRLMAHRYFASVCVARLANLTPFAMLQFWRGLLIVGWHASHVIDPKSSSVIRHNAWHVFRRHSRSTTLC
ncbi:MAG: hypothetical protein R3C28_18715 [Pirellulaceae bacterium]